MSRSSPAEQAEIDAASAAPPPRRMTDEEVDEDVMFIGRLLPEVACRAIARLAHELRRARAEEERLSRLDGDGWKLAEALALELGEQIAARLTAEDENVRLRAALPQIRANLNGAMGRVQADDTTRAYLGAALSLLAEASE